MTEEHKPKVPRPRPRLPSVPELAKKIADLEEDVAEITASHDVPVPERPRPTSTPPALRRMQKRWWNLTLRMLGAAAIAFAGAAGGWLWRDCLTHVHAAPPATIEPSP